MPIYHLTTKNIGRSGGRSATASAAYRSAEKIKDQRQDMTFNYRARSQSVDHAEIIASSHAPEFCKNRSQLWNAVELSEKRKDARVAREVEIALPRELSIEQNIELAREFVKSSFVSEGMVADLCIHDAKGDNPHAHIMLTTRHLTPEGFGQKNREWNKDEILQKWREDWEKVCNKHLEKHNIKERIDHRTLSAQGINRTPQKHLGVQASSIEKRTGEPSHNRIKDEMRQTASTVLTGIFERLKLKKEEEQRKALELERERQKQLEIEKQRERERSRSRGYGMGR